MLAVIQKVENGYIARYERQLKHSVEKVWSWLTENDKLAQWFPELRVKDLREGGIIKFDHRMTDHTAKDLAGWHVCLDVIRALLDGTTLESREAEWKKWHEQYVRAVAEASENQQ